MATRNHAAVMADYRAALKGLYPQPAAGAGERGAATIAAGPGTESRAQEYENRSEELGRQLAEERQKAKTDEERELAAMELLAAAAADIHVAGDLIATDPRAANEPAERGAEGGVPVDVLAFLEKPAIAQAAGERGARPTDPAKARTELEKTAKEAIEDILQDAAAAGATAFTGLTEIPLPPLKDSANLLFHDLMLKLGQGLSYLVRRAIGLVLGAVEKILTALGPGWDSIRDKVNEWIESLKDSAGVAKLLPKLYQTDKIQEAVNKSITDATATTAAAFNGTGDRLEALVGRFQMQKKAIGWVARGMSWARPWIIGVQPWGPPALVSVYVSLLGYAIAAGGDYLDWYRVGGDGTLFDFVAGVRTVVREGLK